MDCVYPTQHPHRAPTSVSKQIGAILRKQAPDGGAAWIEKLTAASFGPQSRAEQIPLELWTALAG